LNKPETTPTTYFHHIRDGTLKANQIDTMSQDRYRASLAGIKKLLRMLAGS